MAGNLSTTLTLGAVLGAGWIASMSKAGKDLNLLGGAMGKLRDRIKELKKAGAAPGEIKALADISSQLGKINSDVNKSAKSFRSFAGFLAGGVKVATGFGGALLALGKSTADSILEVNTSARALGLGRDALQELRYSASLAGVEAGTLDAAIKKLNDNLGKSLTGSGGEAAKALERLNLDMKALEAMPVEVRMGAIGDALKKISSDAERSSISSALFGQGHGAQTGAWLAQGSAALLADMEAAKKNGASISDSDVTSALDFKQAFKDLAATASGLWRTLGIGVLKPIADVLFQITKFIKDNKAAFAEAFAALVSSVSSALSPIIAMLVWLARLGAWFVSSPARVTMLVYALGALGIVIASLKLGTFISSAKSAVIGIVSLTRSVGLAKVAMAAFNFVMSANPIGLIIIAVAALIGIIYLLWKNWDTIWGAIKSFTLAVWDAIKSAALAVWDALKSAWDWCAGLCVKIWTAVGSFFSGLWDSIKIGLASAWEFIKNIFSWSPLGLVIKAYGVMFKWLEDKFGIFSKIGGAIKGIGRFFGLGKKDDPADGGTASVPSALAGGGPIQPRQRQRQIASEINKTQKAEATTATAAARVDVGGITINAAPGQSEKEIAAAVADELEARQQAAADSLLSDLAHA
jgi:hypothetical protein